MNERSEKRGRTGRTDIATGRFSCTRRRALGIISHDRGLSMSHGSTKRLGNALEDIVSALHNLPGVTVATRVALPVIGSQSGRTREIDVLVSSEVAGYPVRIAFECKNEQEAVGTQRIDEAIGKLADVGIPCSDTAASARRKAMAMTAAGP